MTVTAGNTFREKQKAQWRIKDLIDLEYFLHGGSHTEDNNNDASYNSKNRYIYLSRLRHLRDDGSVTARRLLIRKWLDIRRENETVTLPGSIYGEVSQICLVAAAVLGLFAGISLALSLLDYSGDRPLNVSVYMGVAVFSQILLFLLLVGAFTFRTASRSLVQRSVLMKLGGRMFSAAITRIHKGARLDGHKREALAAAAGLFRGRKQVYGSIFFWPVFILMQLFAVCFNVGLLGATLLKLSGSDVAFGWQSTFQVSVPAVYHLVETLAIPWRWMVPATLAYPSLDAIEGSRIILKEGIASRATGDLVSWWPFLCFSVLFYGLLPRLVFLISGIIAKRYLLACLPLNHEALNRLVRAMTRPVFSTAGLPAAGSEQVLENASPSVTEGVAYAHGNYLALIPEDLRTDCAGLEDIVARELSLQVTHRQVIGGGETDDHAVLAAVETVRSTPNFGGVLVLQEAWQPPIRENMNFLKLLRHRLGTTAGIVVGLIGKPGMDTLFTAPGESDFRIWKHRIDALGDPYLGAERLVSHD